MDLTMITDLLGSIDPMILGSAGGGILICSVAALYVKKNKNKFIDNTDPLAQSNDFKTLKTEDLEREFGSLTVQTKMLDEDESLFFDKGKNEHLKEDIQTNEPSTKLVDEASVFDCFDKHEQAIESLKKAVDIEQHDKEKVRLKILLNQYTQQKGKVTLDQLIAQYPSFHTKVSFGNDNTISSLLSMPIPRSDIAVNDATKNIHKEFDIFADLPMLDAIPATIPVHSASNMDKNYIHKDTQHNSINENNINVNEKVGQENTVDENSVNANIFPELPSLEETHSVDISHNNETNSTNTYHTLDSGNLIPPLQNEKLFKELAAPVETDQFSWHTPVTDNHVQESTELILKELQKDADAIDKLNENEAIDDMQKFWKEFGNMVPETAENISESKIINHSDKNNSNNNTNDYENHSVVVNSVDNAVDKNHFMPTAPIEEPAIPFFPFKKQSVDSNLNTIEKNSDIPFFNTIEEPPTVPSIKNIEDTDSTVSNTANTENIPVLHQVLNTEEVLVPQFIQEPLPAIHDTTSQDMKLPPVLPDHINDIPTPVLTEVLNNVLTKDFNNKTHDNQVNEIVTEDKNSESSNPIEKKDFDNTDKAVIKEEVKPAKPYRVWANWIVNLDGQQVFKNHFVNLKNPWGSALAAQELYMGITKLSGNTADDKPCPWVLVSVFPLTKEA